MKEKATEVQGIRAADIETVHNFFNFCKALMTQGL